MNAADRASLATVPVPVDAHGQPARACIVLTSDGWRTAWATAGGKETFGPVYATARDAAAASRFVNARGQA